MTNEERKALVERLHDQADRRHGSIGSLRSLEWLAADQIEADGKRIAELEAALREIVDNCGECGGYGTYPAEETVTGKVLWWDCSNGSCNTARAALGETK